MKKILLFLVICLFFSCKKEKTENSVSYQSRIVIDSAFNFYSKAGEEYPGIFVKFRVQPSNYYNPQITTQWVSPDSLAGFGPYRMKVEDSLYLKVRIKDPDGNVKETLSLTIYPSVINDSLIPVYDYRDRIVGNYSCLARYNWPSFDSAGHIIWNSDTSATKVLLESRKLPDYNYGITLKGQLWTLEAFVMENYDFHQLGYHTPDHGRFYAEDSIYCWIKEGVMTNYDYFGQLVPLK